MKNEVRLVGFLILVVVIPVLLPSCYFTGKAYGDVWNGGYVPGQMAASAAADLATSPIQVPIHLARQAAEKSGNKKVSCDEAEDAEHGAEEDGAVRSRRSRHVRR